MILSEYFFAFIAYYVFAIISDTNLLEFPFPGECAINHSMVGGAIIVALANFSLAFTETMLRLPVQ